MAPRRLRIELDEPAARALHEALSATCELPLRVEPEARTCPSSGCDGRIGERSAAWKALLRDGSVE